MLKVVKFSHFLTRIYKGMPGDEIRLASLFFDTASRTRKRKRNRRSEYPKALWYAVAGVKTFKRPCARLLPDIEKHVQEFPEQGTHSGSCYYSNLCFDQLHLLMPCVTSNARMASSTASCLWAANPIIFHESPLVAIILAWLPTTLFRYLHQSVLQPLHLWSAHSSCRFCQSPLSQHGSILDTHHACSPAHWQKATGSFSCIHIRHWCWCAWKTLTFSFYFNLGVILIYSPRSYEAGAFLVSALRGQPPALDNDFSMNLPFSLPTCLCLQQ